jgi:hypothetical protein
MRGQEIGSAGNSFQLQTWMIHQHVFRQLGIEKGEGKVEPAAGIEPATFAFLKRISSKPSPLDW